LVFELCHEDFERFEDTAGKDYSRLESLDVSLDDEEKETLARFLVAPFALPAEIWFDIRNHPDIRDPPSFIGDVDFLERCSNVILFCSWLTKGKLCSIVAGGMPRDHESSALDEE